MRQGNRTLKEYMDDFYALSRYAPEDIDTDGKRKEKFLKGLCDELKIPLAVIYAPNYQALLDQAITLEDSIKKAENRKRKQSGSKYNSEVVQKKPHYHESNGGSNHKHHGHNHNGSNGGYKGNGHAAPNNNGHHHPNTAPKKDLSRITRYICKKQGHYL